MSLYALSNRESKTWEAILMYVISFLIIPGNMLAIYRFYKQKLNKMFFLLASSLCINNFGMSFLGFLMAAAKASDTHPFQQAGCVLVLTLIGGIATFTMAVQAFISYERRRAVTSTTFLTFSYRIYIFLALALIYPFTYWAVFFEVFGGADYVTVRTNPNTTETIGVCSTDDVAFYGSNEVTFAIQGYLIPCVFIIYNYWPIWRMALNKVQEKDSIAAIQKRRQIRLGVIMSVTVFEFVFFYLPMFAVIMTTVFQRFTRNLTMGNEWSTVGFSLWLLDSVFNPLWTTMLPTKKSKVSTIGSTSTSK